MQNFLKLHANKTTLSKITFAKPSSLLYPGEVLLAICANSTDCQTKKTNSSPKADDSV